MQATRGWNRKLEITGGEGFGRTNKDYLRGRLHPTLSYLIKKYGHIRVYFQEKRLDILPDHDLSWPEILDINKIFPIQRIAGGGSWGGSWLFVICDISKLKYIKIGKDVIVDPILQKYESLPLLNNKTPKESIE